MEPYALVTDERYYGHSKTLVINALDFDNDGEDTHSVTQMDD